ncbi:MAG: carboxypeptidase regulatory-like domain-containing protein [Chloroflexi bacterium]|nr:carboxypeptidase regulatory-like domain-containing protein [Chloroflexota bacterium]
MSKRFWLIGILPMLAALIFMLGMRVSSVAAQSAPPGPYCDDSQHDPTKWHPAVDPVTGCWYGHEHGADPNPPGSPFQPLVFSGDEATPNENFYKHNGYKVFYIHRSNPNSPEPTADPCDDIRLRIHMDVTPRERVGQYHSFEAAIAHCANGQLDVSYIQGWVDFGTVVSKSTRNGDPGIRPMKFAPDAQEFQQYGLNIWEVWYGRTGLGLDMGWLMGEVPTLHHDGSVPDNPSSWNWTGGEGRVRKVENFNFYGWRETRRGEFWTDQFGNGVDSNSAFCKDPNNKCLRQYISPLFGTTRNDQIVFNLAYNNTFDTTGVRFPETFPVDGPHLPWWNGQQPQPTATTPPSDPPATPVPPTPDQPVDPNEPAARVDVSPASAGVGAAVQMSLNILNITDLYGLQAQCTTDPKVLVGTTPAAGDIFTRDNSIGIDKGFDAATGSWLIAGSRRKPNPAFSGSGVAFRLNYTVQAEGSSPVNCAIIAVNSQGKPIPLTIINGSFNTTQAAPSPVPVEPTITPEPILPTETPIVVEPPMQTPPPSALATISGTASYQNHPTNAGIMVRLLDAGGSVLAEVMTGENGAYSFTDVPAGAYTIQMSAPGHLLWQQSALVEADGQVLELGQAMLAAGDTNGDGVVDLTDAGLVGANFGANVPPAPNTADLNADALVDIRDLTLIGANFELRGPTNGQ